MLLCEDIAEQKVLFGSQLYEEQRKALSKFLFNNRDVFAWLANDLCGVNSDVIKQFSQCEPNHQTKEAEASEDVRRQSRRCKK
jgi:dsDNA-binding SOS-regulon protein